MKWRKPIVQAMSVVSLAWCLVAGAYIWLTPVHRDLYNSNGFAGRIEMSFSQVSAAGPLPLLVPVGVALIAVWAARSERLGVLVGAALGLAALSFLGAFSIGGAYLLPAGLLGLGSVIAAYEDVSRLGRA